MTNIMVANNLLFVVCVMFCTCRTMDQLEALLARTSMLEAEVAELRHGHLAPHGHPASPGPRQLSVFHGVN